MHNTAGQWHAYLLHTDADGRAQVSKEFSVFPHYPADGCYQLSFPRPGTRLSLTITLDSSGGRSFVTTVRGSAVRPPDNR